MKKQLIILLAICATQMANAQAPADTRVLKEKMSPLLFWAGNWKGEGVMMMPGGERKTTVEEKIEVKLDNTALLIEGIGRATDPATKTETVVHNALAVLTFDQQSNQYKFRSWLKDGRSTDAWFNVIGDKNYQWGFESPMGKIRYTITIDTTKNTWNEIGEFSQDGSNWRKFFEMNLTKV